MNRRLTLSASVIVIGGLALGLAAGCASKSMSKMGSGDVVADRQRLMKLQGASWADIQAKAKNEQLTQDIVKDFGRNTCGICHTPFRQPPPRT